MFSDGPPSSEMMVACGEMMVICDEVIVACGEVIEPSTSRAD